MWHRNRAQKNPDRPSRPRQEASSRNPLRGRTGIRPTNDEQGVIVPAVNIAAEDDCRDVSQIETSRPSRHTSTESGIYSARLVSRIRRPPAHFKPSCSIRLLRPRRHGGVKSSSPRSPGPAGKTTFPQCFPARCRHAVTPSRGAVTLTAVRIAIVTESFLPHVNGVATSVCRVLEHLVRRGHEVLQD